MGVLFLGGGGHAIILRFMVSLDKPVLGGGGVGRGVLSN